MEHDLNNIRRKISKQEKEAFFKVYDGRCAWCEKEVGKNFEIDHVIPFSKKGSCELENLVLSCKKCNSIKGAKLVPQQYIGIVQILAKKNAKKIRKILNSEKRCKSQKFKKPHLNQLSKKKYAGCGITAKKAVSDYVEFLSTLSFTQSMNSELSNTLLPSKAVCSSQIDESSSQSSISEYIAILKKGFSSLSYTNVRRIPFQIFTQGKKMQILFEVSKGELDTHLEELRSIA